MEILRLAEVPQHADTVAHWIWHEWHDHSRVSLEETKARVLHPFECPPTLLARIEGAPVGVLGFRRFQREGEAKRSLFIDVLYVRESSRARGIGSALLKEAIARARSVASELFVYTDKRAWYESRGWRLVDAKPPGVSAVLVWRGSSRSQS